VSGWEVAGYGLWFAALLGFIGFIAREFVTDGRKHQAANERIGDTHQPVLVQTQAWQQSCGTGTTVHPAPQPHRLSSGSADLPSGGRHTQAARGSRDVSDEQARRVVGEAFNVRVTGEPTVASMPARLPWDVLDRARGSAVVASPFNEQIHVRNEVLNGRLRAAANDEPTQLMPTVPPGGAR